MNVRYKKSRNTIGIVSPDFPPNPPPSKREEARKANGFTEYLRQYLIEQKLEIEGLKLPENKKIRDELIGLLRKESDLSLRRIAEVLQINREIVRRAVTLLSKEPSP